MTETPNERPADRGTATDAPAESSRTDAAADRPPTIPDWLPEVEQQLDCLPRLPVNWDSYGAAPPDPETVQAAREFLRTLVRRVPVPKPYVSPTPTGGVFFEWQYGNYELELEVVSTERVEYVYEDMRTGRMTPGAFALPDRDAEEFLQIMRDHFSLSPYPANKV